MIFRITVVLAFFLRLLPDFKGKSRLGRLWESLFLKNSKIEETKIRLKRGDVLYVDPRSHTHKGPFWTGRYDDDIINQFSSLFQKDWVVMDIGANIGYYTIPFARRLKDLNGNLLAFEPVKANYKTLLRNIQVNRVNSVVKPFQLALGNEEGFIEMKITEEGETSNAYMAKVEINSIHTFNTEKVAIQKLDTFIDQQKIQRCDFIKVDIEGSEIFLFQGSEKLIERFRPLVYGEFNTYFLPIFGYNFLDVWELFRPYNYECYEQIGNSSKFKMITPKENSFNVLLVPPQFDKGRLKFIGYN